MLRGLIKLGLLFGFLWVGCRSDLLAPMRDAQVGNGEIGIERNLTFDTLNPCTTRPLNQVQAMRLFEKYVYRDNPTYNPQSQFTVEELDVTGAWEAMGVQLFSGGSWSNGYVINTRPFVIHACKLYPLTQSSSTELLSAILVNSTIYYTIRAGSGINYSELGKLSLVENELYILQGADYGRPDPNHLYLREVDGNLLLELGSGIKFNTWIRISTFGWLRDDGINLMVVDESGKVLTPQGLGGW